MNRPAWLATLRKTVRFCGFLLAAIVFTAPLAFGGVNRWTSNGPSGATVTSLAIDPMDPETVYAGTGREVFKTRDGGLSWITSFRGIFTGFGPGSSGLAIDPLFSSHVYAATDDGVFKSVDAGGSWAAVGLSNGFAYSVAFDPAHPSTVFAGTARGLFQSHDRGANWGRVLSAEIYNIVFPHRAPSTILGADSEPQSFYPADSQLYKSTDAGATWSSNSAGIAINPGALAIDPTNPSTLYAGDLSDNYSRFGGLYKSVDSGSTWLQLSEWRSVSAVVVDPRNPRVLYVASRRGSSEGVFRSTDGGGRWVEFNAGLTSSVSVLAIDRTGTRLYAGTNAGVFSFQIYSGVPDLAARADSTARLLFVDPEGRVAFRSFDNSGNSGSGVSYGPFNGWYATALADGSDGLTRVLWNHLDGSAALWLLGPTSSLASYRYSPGAGWIAVDVSVKPDGITQILWTNTDGRTSLWSLDLSGTVVRAVTFGPYPGWLARSISSGPGGLTRLLWSNSDGRIGLSLIDAGEITATYRFEPPAGWTAQDLTVAADNRTRILLSNGDGLAALWTVSNSGVLTNSQATYEPPAAAQTAARISAGPDGLTRLLWTGPEVTGTMWLLDLSNVFQASFRVGATP